ncbi:IclR family transcriptional regulator [Fusibacter paucivorans]|uniref:IclR family transcriptional regulator n=1 Tax=Fusibacter paucivorans TaxID=76009 RepID=A0ABS5PLB1_9FIRM|nr:IclR family transcriptional regulator [Fusibacter paucivorans]MBS7525953.1 IclR family transcriptional regulator [Fusibacter paucivorans]
MKEENNSLRKALTVLDLFLRRDRLTIKDIMQLTGYSKSAVNRIMSTLESTDYVIRTKEDYQYALANKVFFLGERTDLYRNILAVCGDEVEALSVRSGFSVTISVRERNMSVTIFKRESNSTMSLVPNVGDHKSLHCSASGKVLFAYTENKESLLEQILFNAVTEHTIVDKDRFLEAVERVKHEHVAYDDEELSPGLFCVAMPVVSKNGDFLCSISLSGYKPKMLEKMTEVKAELRQSIERIRERL